jgi:hypothetical protein
MAEILRSDVPQNQRLAMSRTVQLQLDNVERTISQIRRRERAEKEERRARRNPDKRRETAREIEARRRRRADMRERSIRVRRDLLYPARRGGFDPQQANQGMNMHPAAASASGVAFDIAGQSGEINHVADTAPAPVVDVVI